MKDLYSDELLDAVLHLDGNDDKKAAFFSSFRGRVHVVTSDDWTKSVPNRNTTHKVARERAIELLRERLIF